MENANLELLIADQLLEVLGGLLTPAAGELKAHWPQPWASERPAECQVLGEVQ